MNTIWHTTSTASAISSAASTPQTCDTRRTAVTKRSKLLDAQRFLDQLFAVRHFLRELGVRALLRHLHPGVVLGGAESHHLDLVLLEYLHHLVVEPLRLLGEKVLRLAPRLHQRVLLLLVQP